MIIARSAGGHLRARQVPNSLRSVARSLMIRALPAVGFLLVFWFSLEAKALEIRQTRWGYDGRVLPAHFNLFSVLVENDRGQPFDGELRLEETRGIANRVGAPYVQKVYLAPNTSRWVQFIPFITSESNWTLRWGRKSSDEVSIDGAPFGGPAQVFLVDPTGLSQGQIKLKTFPADLFPTSVVTTDALHAVVLDHLPKWEPTRREAFLDWLRRGGTVHVLRDSNGPIAFEGELEILNGGTGAKRIGAGKVVQHERMRHEVDDVSLASMEFPVPELKKGDNIRIYAFDSTVLQNLAQMAKPEIAWWLIYLLTVAYIVVVGPAHYRWGRKLDYRLSIGGFLGIVGLFSIAFSVVGRRGIGEVQVANSVSIARALGEGRFDVMQWVNAFVTDGDYYRLTHRAESKAAINVYSTAAEIDAVNGQIHSGRDGHFEVDIPLYSSRGFVHKAVMKGDDTEVAVEEWNGGTSLTKLILKPGPDFPKVAKAMWVRVGDQVYPMKAERSRLVAQIGEGEDIKAFFAPDKLQLHRSYRSAQGGENNEESAASEWIKETARVFIARALGGCDAFQHYVPIAPLQHGHAQLFVLAQSPEGFRMHGENFDRENGWTIYVQDIFQPMSGEPVEKR